MNKLFQNFTWVPSKCKTVRHLQPLSFKIYFFKVVKSSSPDTEHT